MTEQPASQTPSKVLRGGRPKEQVDASNAKRKPKAAPPSRRLFERKAAKSE